MQEGINGIIPEINNHLDKVDSLELESIITIDVLKKCLGKQYDHLTQNELQKIRIELYMFWKTIIET